MKEMCKFMAFAVFLLVLCIAVSTAGYSVVDPSIGIVRVVRYGFPLTWIKVTTSTPQTSPTQFAILWFELFVDVVFYAALSLIASLLVRYTASLEVPKKASLPAKMSLIFLVTYFTRLASCGIHELLGHGLWAWIFGASHIQVYVSWLGFGWCSARDLTDSYVARVLFSAGGLLNTFVIGAVILTLLYLLPKGGFYLRFLLFWLGFWATINQASYLFLGGVTAYGDPGSLHLLTGLPLSFFVFLGFGLFLVVYFVVSVLFFSEVSVLFPEYGERTLLFEFWLTIPIQVILFAVSPQHAISELFILLFAVSLTPGLLSLLLFPVFNRLRMMQKRTPQYL